MINKKLFKPKQPLFKSGQYEMVSPRDEPLRPEITEFEKKALSSVQKPDEEYIFVNLNIKIKVREGFQYLEKEHLPAGSAV